MTIVVIVVGLIIAIAVLLILVVLAQKPKGGGLASQFGGAGTSQMMGVKKTNDILEKLTWGFAIGIIVLTISTSFIIKSTQGRDSINSINVERARSSAPAVQAPLPTTTDTNAATIPVTPLDTTAAPAQ